MHNTLHNELHNARTMHIVYNALHNVHMDECELEDKGGSAAVEWNSESFSPSS